MQIEKTNIPDLFILTPKVFEDKRGYFYESYNQKLLSDEGVNTQFVQDNQSRSSYGVIRGLHFQNPPKAQTKLIRVLEGKILDVVVDIRAGFPTYGKYFSIELSEANKKQLFIPKGMAHGFSVLSEKATIHYKCDDFYSPGDEGGLRYDDPTLNIDWKIPEEDMILSDKDQQHPFFKDLQTHFIY